MAVGCNFDAISSNSIVDELQGINVSANIITMMRGKYLVVLRGELVETFLNDMVAVEVLDKHNNMEAECHNNRVNLNIVSLISLNSPVSLEEKRKVNRTCLSPGRQEVNHFLYSTSTMHVE